ncbi:MAG: hypothetical protein HC808_19770, partial [Candidatus Competibacteraceae bacterium]|nr:hypothetical protein [Candidatus Competibacteraceae bacterium]
SKLAITETEDIVDFPTGPALTIHELDGDANTVPVQRMGRGALRIRIGGDDWHADVITAHLKSKLLTFKRPGYSSFSPRDEDERAQVAGIALLRRTAEAVTLRLRINALLAHNADCPLLLLGDFNDVPEAQTSLILCGPPGSTIGTRGFDRPDQGDDTRLFNLAPLIPQERLYSRIHAGRGELLDQIFASEEFLARDADQRRRLPAVDSWIDFADGLPSVTDDAGQRAQDIAPDHAPVTAVFTL